MSEKQQKPVVQTILKEWLPTITWGIAIAMVAFMVFVYLKPPAQFISSTITEEIDTPLVVEPTQTVGVQINLPEIQAPKVEASIPRAADPFTIQSARTRTEVVSYQVEHLDSIFGISGKFNLQPETLLWANYDVLNDNPDMLSEGQVLIIPPVDGIVYEWKEGDTVEKVANEFYAEENDILLFSGNNLDLTNPEIEPGQQIMIPNGYRQFVSWVVPTIPIDAAGVSTTVLGSGGCIINAQAYGSGGFTYPTAQHRLSGNDYWSGHLALDFAVGLGDPVFASDSGVVIYSGWNSSGYGYMVMIDHGNGYQTLYAHLSQTATSCGASVYQGQVVGFGGSTGNSTGAHLHFEVRYFGGFINPWYVLP